jgi:hypothetical protein
MGSLQWVSRADSLAPNTVWLYGMGQTHVMVWLVLLYLFFLSDNLGCPTTWVVRQPGESTARCCQHTQLRWRHLLAFSYSVGFNLAQTGQSSMC